MKIIVRNSHCGCRFRGRGKTFEEAYGKDTDSSDGKEAGVEVLGERPKHSDESQRLQKKAQKLCTGPRGKNENQFSDQGAYHDREKLNDDKD